MDFGGHWKLLHYAAKRFFNPLLVSAEYSTITHVVDVYLTSDINQAIAGLSWPPPGEVGKPQLDSLRGCRDSAEGSCMWKACVMHL